MPAILTKLREQASRVQPSIAVGVGVGVALAACALYGTRERKQPPCPNNNNNYKVAKNGQLHSVENGGSNGQTCGGHCGAEQCALCRGDVDTDNKQNIEDAEEPAPVEEHFPGLNLEFLRQMVSLAKIMIPGFRSHEVALLAGHTLCLFTRTLLSIYVAALEGSIMKHIVQKDLRRFAALLLQWFGIAIPATFINSMIRYLESRLALAFRTRLVNHAYDMYFKNQTYYRVANLDARIENADHRLTEDVSVFTQSVAHLYGSLTKPCFDLLLIVLTLASYSSKMKGNIFIGPGFATVVICMTGQVLRLLSPRFGALAGEEARMKANLRHVHASIIAHAEEVAFYGGHKVELNQLQTAYKALVAQMTSVFNKKLWYVMLEQFCMKYVWSGTGMVMLALPILTATADGSASQGISERTEYMTTSRHLLNSAADAIERLMSSYKEVVTLAGYAERVSDMLEVFSEVARGECVRAVHVTSGKDNPNAFQVTFRDNRPVPQGKITYTSDLSIHLRSVPIVTPACDVVANGVTLDIAPGTHLLIVGPNGCGKSSLFRIISGLWPVHGGSLAVPRPCACAACADERAPPTRCHSRPIMFYIPQRPYMSMGSLIDQVTYPSRVSPNDQEAFDRATRILKVVRLDACAARHGGLRAVRDWRATLSGGEKQRMAMARMFYHRPVYALLDECTSAVSMETEVVMYEEAVKEGITLLSITHRPSVWKYHSFVLEFDGAGNWSYRPLEKDAPAITPSLPSSVPAPSLPSDSDSN
ncbi:ATP binding cassette subfamily D isoform X1 [Choristoneura fumiferana]|uniref:ATP binding cassette subfamily D isoform X1 n=2 Tax=Choristoneura fumiferana TaxID=7141 RepID=UPI003D15457F